MKNILPFLVFLLLPLFSFGQERPSYCDELPVTYDKGAYQLTQARGSLPKFNTSAVKMYKVQVAILRFTDPSSYPFHEALVARHRPCEEVWVIESKEVFKDKKKADALKKELRDLGYDGAYIIEMLGYE